MSRYNPFRRSGQASIPATSIPSNNLIANIPARGARATPSCESTFIETILHNNSTQFERLEPSPLQNYLLNDARYRTRTIDIDVNVAHVKTSSSQMDMLHLKSVPLPVTFSNLCSSIVNAGYIWPTAVQCKADQIPVSVTGESSAFDLEAGGQINMDQPLLHYYHKSFLTAVADKSRKVDTDADQLPLTMSGAKVNKKKDRVDVRDIGISFRRTVRVPDNDETHLLPPNLGEFTIYNVADFTDRLPARVVEKGGVFISMYQREAMWTYFTSQPKESSIVHNPREHAVKISVGGLNALTGRAAEVPAPEGVQDYLPVGGVDGQLWLDGIYTAPNEVRQFIAMPLGKGYTVEGQITGKEDIGGMQIDVFRRLPETVSFLSRGEELPLLATPRTLGLKVGDEILMIDKLSIPSSLLMSIDSKDLYACGRKLEVTVDPHVIVETKSNKTVRVICEVDKSRVTDLHQRVTDITGYFGTLCYDGVALKITKTLGDYNISSGAKLVMELRTQADLGGIMSQRTGALRAELSRRKVTLGADDDSYEDEFSGFAAGGRISQKIVRDRLPATAYDIDSPERLHVHVLNAAYFHTITGLPAPPSPIDSHTYLRLGLPWYQIFEEYIPRANNAGQGAAQALEEVRSIAQLDTELAHEGNPVQQGCTFCHYQMATSRLIPCRHVVCNDCSEGLEPRACPICPQFVRAREKFAAPAVMPGLETNVGITVDHIHMDEQSGKIQYADAAVVMLRRYAGTGVVVSSKIVGTNVSVLSGV